MPAPVASARRRRRRAGRAFPLIGQRTLRVAAASTFRSLRHSLSLPALAGSRKRRALRELIGTPREPSTGAEAAEIPLVRKCTLHGKGQSYGSRARWKS